jgi:hypothetical protein
MSHGLYPKGDTAIVNNLHGAIANLFVT